MISGLQVKLARTALGWSVRELADRAAVNFNTVSRYENGAGAHSRTVESLERTLVAAGIMFIPEGRYEGTGGPGVRFAIGADQAVPNPEDGGKQ
jgi:transcriptional regulator with XRE-family HTH domain